MGHDARGVEESVELLLRPWRTGRRVGRNIYAQVGDDPSDDDVIIGQMDTAELAQGAVDSHNVAYDVA
jgi:hypothetical protein